ncbi:MAG: hypothetical protein AVDCRST_MAG55-2347, partial [uncultured Rubrobacteraceae bacterium]
VQGALIRRDLLGAAGGEHAGAGAGGLACRGDSPRGSGGAQDRDALRRRRFRRGRASLEAHDPGPPAGPPGRGQVYRRPERARDHQGARPARRRLRRLQCRRRSLGGPLHRRGLGQPEPPSWPRQPPHGRRLHLEADRCRRGRSLRELDGQDVRRRRARLGDSPR